jgi:hypothetical protein
MSKRRYDENIITGLLAGGFGIMLYEVFKAWYQSFIQPIPHDEFMKTISPMIFAGFLVAAFAVCYAVFIWHLRKKQTNNE